MRTGFGRQHAQLPKYLIGGEPPVTRPGHFVPTPKEATDGVIEIQFHPVSRLRHRPIAEVGRPSPHRAVQAPRHVFPWRVITGPQASPDMFLDRGHSLLGRPRTVVASAGSRRVHRPEGIAEEVEGLASGVAYTRLGLVQRETDAGHPSPSRFEDLTGAMPTQDHEIPRRSPAPRRTDDPNHACETP